MDQKLLETLSTSPPVEAAVSALWEAIDAVLVLNLDHRTERWEHLRVATAGLIPAGKLHRVPAVMGNQLPGFGLAPWFRGRKRDSTWAARGGCVLAHRQALETANKAGWNHVLILEDDVSFDENLTNCLNSLHTALFESALKWDVCYLGYTDPRGPFLDLASLSGEIRLTQVFGCNCAHAYLLGAAPRDWLLAHMPDKFTIWSWLAHNRAVDRWYRNILGQQFRVIALSQSLINQSAGFSDIVGRDTHYIEEGVHRLCLPETKTASTYALRYLLRIQLTRLAQFYDRLRSIRKRHSGF